jgi:copper resistance protein C
MLFSATASVRTICVTFFAVIFLFVSVPLQAHAILVSSVPGLNGMVKGPDTPVRLRFNSRIDLKRSRLVLVAPNGSQQVLALTDLKAPDMLVSEAKGLAPGSYLLHWQVLASDGHITRGEVPFQVR